MADKDNSKNPKPLPSKDELNNALEYRDGILVWKTPPNRRIRSGDAVGSQWPNGYIQFQFNKRKLLSHRVIFFMFNGYVPDIIDHIDGNPSNNKIENLRTATTINNCQNAKIGSGNTSGVKGVHWSNSSKRWVARIKYNKKNIHIGEFNCIRMAETAIRAAREKLHGEFANHG